MDELFAIAAAGRRSAVRPCFPRARAGRPRRHLQNASLAFFTSDSLLALPADRPYDDLRLVPR